MVSAFFFDGKKEKFGRSPGSGLNEPESFLWNQSNAYEENRPHGLWKLEVNQTFSPDFFMSAKVAYYNNGFGLFARDAGASYTYDYVRGETVGTYYDYYPVRPQKAVNVDGSYFKQALGGNHELKFGFGYRDVTSNTTTHWNGNQLVGYINTDGTNIAKVYRDGVVGYTGKYLDFYIGDVYTRGRLSINAGVRWDQQKAKNLASEAPANASFPDVLPSLSYAGDSSYPIDWKDFSPRVGLSYALDQAQKTVLRASYARYAGQLSFGWVTDENPVASGYLAYNWNDTNGDRLVQPGEVLLNEYQYSVNIDPDNPTAVGSTPNKIDRDFKARRTPTRSSSASTTSCCRTSRSASPTPTGTTRTSCTGRASAARAAPTRPSATAGSSSRTSTPRWRRCPPAATRCRRSRPTPTSSRPAPRVGCAPTSPGTPRTSTASS